MNQISEILQNARTIAVVGLSGKRFRPSYGVAEYMHTTETDGRATLEEMAEAARERGYEIGRAHV